MVLSCTSTAISGLCIPAGLRKKGENRKPNIWFWSPKEGYRWDRLTQPCRGQINTILAMTRMHQLCSCTNKLTNVSRLQAHQTPQHDHCTCLLQLKLLPATCVLTEKGATISCKPSATTSSVFDPCLRGLTAAHDPGQGSMTATMLSVKLNMLLPMSCGPRLKSWTAKVSG